MKVSQIIMRGKINGRGLVNFDDDSKKWMLKNTPLFPDRVDTKNIKYSKKVFERNPDYVVGSRIPEFLYKQKISSACLRKGIFDDEVTTPSTITTDPVLLHMFIGTESGILRGYAYLNDGEKNNQPSVKNKSGLSVESSIQTCNAVSVLELNSRSGNKESNNTSLFYTETCGDIEYDFKAFLDIETTRFLSGDIIHDRLAYDHDYIDILDKALKMNVPYAKYEHGLFTKNTSNEKIPELGVYFDEGTMMQLIKNTLKRIFKLQILRSGSYAEMSELEIKLVLDPKNDTIEDGNNWIKINNVNDIDSLDFEIMDFMTNVTDIDEYVNAHKSIVDDMKVTIKKLAADKKKSVDNKKKK